MKEYKTSFRVSLQLGTLALVIDHISSIIFKAKGELFLRKRSVDDGLLGWCPIVEAFLCN